MLRRVFSIFSYIIKQVHFNNIATHHAEDLKIAIRAEAKEWKVLYARSMNTKYLALMDKIMEMMDDYSKRFSRPINDLDDVRQAMAALKELRENEIFIDSSLDPIEVCGSHLAWWIFLYCHLCYSHVCVIFTYTGVVWPLGQASYISSRRRD